jgi:superfamily II DNA helicase RecQ
MRQIVISPLLSLMQDQVESLLKIGIATLTFSSTQTDAQKRWAYDGDLFKPFYHFKILFLANNFCLELYKSDIRAKLVYVTPEMINRSPKFQNVISSLHNRRKLAR